MKISNQIWIFWADGPFKSHLPRNKLNTVQMTQNSRDISYYLRVPLCLCRLGHADGGDLLPPPRLDRLGGRSLLLYFGGGGGGTLRRVLVGGVLAHAHDALRPASV